MPLGAKDNGNLDSVFQSVAMAGKVGRRVQLQVRISIKCDDRIHGFNKVMRPTTKYGVAALIGNGVKRGVGSH